MAKLRAHGGEIGRIDRLTESFAFMSDGQVLRNRGHGWLLYRKVKAGIDPRDFYISAKSAMEQFYTERPAFAAYRDKLHALAGIGKRWRLHQSVSRSPDDPAAVFADACGSCVYTVHATIEQIADLCAAYRAAIAEKRSAKHEIEQPEAA